MKQIIIYKCKDCKVDVERSVRSLKNVRCYFCKFLKKNLYQKKMYKRKIKAQLRREKGLSPTK